MRKRESRQPLIPLYYCRRVLQQLTTRVDCSFPEALLCVQKRARIRERERERKQVSECLCVCVCVNLYVCLCDCVGEASP